MLGIHQHINAKYIIVEIIIFINVYLQYHIQFFILIPTRQCVFHIVRYIITFYGNNTITNTLNCLFPNTCIHNTMLPII